MYIPRSFQVEDPEVLAAFIRAHSFATLISAGEEAPFATHLPLLLEEGVLRGHLARANPHWRLFDGQRQSLAIFHGPHAYVSPTWYTTSPAVPTWNYAAVHVYGAPRPIEEEARLSALVDRLAAVYEAKQPQPWPGVLPPEYRAKMLQGIVGFEMEIGRIEGKFKLGQNRSRQDQLGVLARLESSADPQAQALAALARAQLPPG